MVVNFVAEKIKRGKNPIKDKCANHLTFHKISNTEFVKILIIILDILKIPDFLLSAPDSRRS